MGVPPRKPAGRARQVFRFHIQCGDIFQSQGFGRMLRCHGCGYELAKTSKSYSAICDREEHEFVGTEAEFESEMRERKEREEEEDREFQESLKQCFEQCDQEQAEKIYNEIDMMANHSCDVPGLKEYLASQAVKWHPLMKDKYQIPMEFLGDPKLMTKSIIRVAPDKPTVQLPTVSRDIAQIAEVRQEVIPPILKTQYFPVESGDVVPTVRLSKLSCDIAPKAEYRVRRPRAGKRVKPRKPGYCYLRYIPKKLRDALSEELLNFPKAKELSEVFKRYQLTPRSARLVTYEYMNTIFAHVRHDLNAKPQGQFNWACNQPYDVRIGVELEDLEALYPQDDPHMLIAVKDVAALLPYFTPLQPLECGCEELGNCMRCADSEPLPDVLVHNPEKFRIAGSGDCWTTAPWMKFTELNEQFVGGGGLREYDMTYEGDYMHCTVGRFMKMLKEHIDDPRQADYWSKMTLQDDGDYHFHGAHIRTEKKFRGVFGDPHAKDEMDCQTLYDFLQNASQEVQVGAPAVSPIINSINSITSPDVRAALERRLQPIISQSIDKSQEIMPWTVKEELQGMATKLGFNWLPHGDTHPHAIFAAIRRVFYDKLIPRHITCDTTIVGMKKEHFDVLQRAVNAKHGEGTYKLYLQNVVVDFRDPDRYHNSGAVNHQVFELGPINTPAVFFDESGHFLTPDFMVRLAYKNPNLQIIGYTSIFPLLALELPQSPYPAFVDWRIAETSHGPIIKYIPEGDYGGTYEQPYDPTMILAKKFTSELGDVTWNGGVLEQLADHRLHKFYRFHLETHEFMACREETMMMLPRVFRNQPSSQPIMVSDFIKMIEYSKVLPAHKNENYWGKIRLTMKQAGIYVNVADEQLVIDVALEVNRLLESANYQKKDITGVMDFCYYKTVGALIRLYDKKFVVPWRERRHKMISTPDPVKMFPMLSVSVKDTHDDRYFSISWKVDRKQEAFGWWTKMKHWIKILDHRLRKVEDSDLSLEFDEDGKVVFPFLDNTYLNQRKYGIKTVKESQARKFRELYPDAMSKLEPVDVVDVDISSKSSDTETTLVVEEDEEVLKLFDKLNQMLPEEDQIGPQSITQIDSSDDDGASHDKRSDHTSLMPPEFYDKQTFPDHCAQCPSFYSFMQDGGRPEFDAYQSWCDMQHEYDQAKTVMQRRMIKSLAEQWVRDRKARTSPDKNPVTNIPTTHEIKHDGPKITTPYLGDELPYIKKEFGKTPKFGTHQERVDEWNHKWKKELAHIRPTAANMAGKGQWDLLYPDTIDKRWADIPYRNVYVSTAWNYPEEDCLLIAVGEALSISPCEALFRIMRAAPTASNAPDKDMPDSVLHPLALHYGVHLRLEEKVGEKAVRVFNFGIKGTKTIGILYKEAGHMVCRVPIKTGLKIKLASTVRINRGHGKVLSAISRWPVLEWKPWVPEHSRAAAYVRALLDGSVGLLNEPYNKDRLEEWKASTDAPYMGPKKHMAVIGGDPGCRKSSTPQKIMRNKQFQKLGEFNVINSTAVLCQDWKDKLDATAKDEHGRGMPGEMVMTFEKALAFYVNSTLTVTDENKYPKGFHALYHILNPTVQYHLFLGDPWQSSWHNPKETPLNDPSIKGEFEFYMQYMTAYIIGVWRFSGMSAAFWRMPSYSKNKGRWAFTTSMPTVWQELKVLFKGYNETDLNLMWNERHVFYMAHFKAAVGEEMLQVETSSYAGSIGLTVPLAIIEIDDAALKPFDPRAIYTVMTRSANILFVNRWPRIGRCFDDEARHPVLGVVRHYRLQFEETGRCTFDPEYSLSIRDLTFPFPKDTKLIHAGPFEKCTNYDEIKQFWPEASWASYFDPDQPRSGARLAYEHPAYVNEPQFWPYIDATEFPEPEEVLPDERLPPDFPLATSLPVESAEQFIEFYDSTRSERYEAELNVKRLYSTQFIDTPKMKANYVAIMRKMVDTMMVKDKKLTKRKARLKVIAEIKQAEGKMESPIHNYTTIGQWAAQERADDKASYLAAMEQRFKFVLGSENDRNYLQQRDFGDACWAAFSTYLGWHTRVPWSQERYELAVQAFQFRRGERSEQMMKSSVNRADPDFTRLITLKQQLKLKTREFKKARAPQPIHVHPDSEIFYFGPYGILLLDLILEHKPPYWLFYATVTPDELEAWCVEWLTNEPILSMNDQTGQDRNAQGWAVRFFENLLGHFNFPQEMIDKFHQTKVRSFTKDGEKFLAIMTDSGEIWTFLINTTSSTARECLRHNLPPGFPMANGGDDTMAKQFPATSHEYLKLKHLDPCEDKRYQSSRGEFVSFFFRKRLVKDPIILLKRWMVKVAEGKADDSVLGYFELWLRNYRLADTLYEVLDEDEMAAHQIMTRKFFNLKKEGVTLRPDWTKISESMIEHASVVVTVQDADNLLKRIENLIPSYLPQTQFILQDSSDRVKQLELLY